MFKFAGLTPPVYQPCIGDLCYEENTVIRKYLNQPSVRDLLGVTSPNNFTGCSSAVGSLFNFNMDKYSAPTQYYVANLLDRGIPILIYAGTYDWQVRIFVSVTNRSQLNGVYI